MTQVTRYLLCKSRDLCSNPKIHMLKSRVWWHTLVTLTSVDKERDIPGTVPNLLGKFQNYMRRSWMLERTPEIDL